MVILFLDLATIDWWSVLPGSHCYGSQGLQLNKSEGNFCATEAHMAPLEPWKLAVVMKISGEYQIDSPYSVTQIYGVFSKKVLQIKFWR